MSNFVESGEVRCCALTQSLRELVEVRTQRRATLECLYRGIGGELLTPGEYGHAPTVPTRIDRIRPGPDQEQDGEIDNRECRQGPSIGR